MGAIELGEGYIQALVAGQDSLDIIIIIEGAYIVGGGDAHKLATGPHDHLMGKGEELR